MEEVAVNRDEEVALFDVNTHISWVASILSERVRACEAQLDFCSVSLL